jgi:antitoxin (DNA-binding transcriptional repressor) of toxin-antitoxin stability system
MKTVTLREMRHNFGPVLLALEAGESIEISRHGAIIGVISPPPPPPKKAVKKKKDFMARFVKCYGANWRERIPAKNSVVADRESRPY